MPTPIGLVVKYGSNTRARSCGRDAGPVVGDGDVHRFDGGVEWRVHADPARCRLVLQRVLRVDDRG